MDRLVECYEDLANAIIERAALDYRMALSGYKNSMGRYISMRELEKFFRSDWFTVLTKVDGEAILNKLRREFEK